jgi:Zn-dependent M28 family amino/carboxypeptidase
VTMKNETKFFPDGIGMNVVGLIPGSDPELKNEVILIGGHLDHCGKAWETCPGANDNASGVAVMLGVAKALATSGIHFKRSILFIGLGAEEQGLNGAKAYISDPPFSISKTIAFLNLDCVGVGPNLHAGGGISFPEVYSVIERANSNYVHRNLSSSINTNLGRPRSDAAIFVQAGIPSITFSSSGGKGAYHTPDDRPSTIWPETLEDLATILTLAIAELAMISNLPEKGN